MRPAGRPGRERWSLKVDEEDLQAYLAEYIRQCGLDDPDADLTAFTLFTVDVMESIETGRDAFEGSREFVDERPPDD